MSVLGRRAYARGRAARSSAALIVRDRAQRAAAGRARRTRSRAARASGSAGRTRVTRRPVVAAGAERRRCCWRSRSRRCRSSSATARCASSRRATRRASAPSWPRKATGPGAAGPTQVVADFDQGARPTPRTARALAAYAAELRARPRGRRGAAPQPSRDGRAALITVAPRHDSGEPAGATRSSSRLRARPGRRSRASPTSQVGGATASVEDFSDLVSGSMWKILLFVLGVQLPGAARAAALGAAAAEGGADEPAVGGRRLRRARRWSSSAAGSTACSASTRSAT